MKRKTAIQLFLATVAFLLIFFTYYNKTPLDQLDSNIDADKENGKDKIENTIKSTEKTTNIIENAKYTGSNNRGAFLK